MFNISAVHADRSTAFWVMPRERLRVRSGESRFVWCPAAKSFRTGEFHWISGLMNIDLSLSLCPVVSVLGENAAQQRDEGQRYNPAAGVTTQSGRVG
ncbi:hypothetical protein F2P81_014298 [Scophthalmus maximus]|uniref:Uncharacterized protein n=1 Tax=Scophthalmus maximus TaxID=52904 RepID=A0A6A4SVX1_SCOMX|nr:hypothetical protein F2P81_014298 [Scophthalmus maximus]